MKKVKRFQEGGYEDTDDYKNLTLAADREAVEYEGEKIAKPLREAAEAKKSGSFKDAFASARKSGDKTFEFGGKKYTTEMAGEKKAASDKKVTNDGMRTPAQEAADDAKIAAAMRKSDKPGSKVLAEKMEKGQPKMQGAYREAVGNIRKALGFKSGGMIGSASKRADGCASRGKTRGRMV